MARIRTIKPSIFTSLTVCGWPVDVRWTFVGLFTYLDDYGRGLNEPRLIKAEIWPMDDRVTTRKVAEHLDVIEAEGPLHTYTVAGRGLLHITTWREHQRISHPTESRWAPCPDCPEPPERFRNRSGTVPEAHANGAGAVPDLARARAQARKGREGKNTPYSPTSRRSP